MYIIVSDKHGAFRSETGDGVETVETWRYLFHGKERARYRICEVIDPGARIAIIDADDESCVNSLALRFFGDFADVAAARAEIESLVRFGDLDARIERVD